MESRWPNVYGIIRTGEPRTENSICVFSVMAPVQNVIYCCIFFNEWNGRACAGPLAVLETRRWWLSNQTQSSPGSSPRAGIHGRHHSHFLEVFHFFDFYILNLLWEYWEVWFGTKSRGLQTMIFPRGLSGKKNIKKKSVFTVLLLLFYYY